MTVDTRPLIYAHQGHTLESIFAFDGKGKKPGILICHTWAGRSEFEIGVAKKMVEWGYAALALDVFGKGHLPETVEQRQAAIKPFLDDRALLQSRLQLAADQLKAQPEVDGGKIAIMGFCFGGLCALDLVRTGADIKGAASFHGLFNPPGNTQGKKIKAKIIALHGWDDPMVPPDAVLAFTKELKEAGADWQLHAFGNTVHGFMNPGPGNPALGIQHSALAERRGWALLKDFLAEIFG
jgi:dienelactone hydrolase